MGNSDRDELRQLVEEQRALTARLEGLGRRIESLAMRMQTASDVSGAPEPEPSATVIPEAPVVAPGPQVTPSAPWSASPEIQRRPPPVPDHFANTAHSTAADPVVPPAESAATGAPSPSATENARPTLQQPERQQSKAPAPQPPPLLRQSDPIKVGPRPPELPAATEPAASLPSTAASAPPSLPPSVHSSAAVPLLPRLPPKPAPAEAEESSFEMEFGAYWLPRIGVTLFVVALGALGTYLYYNLVEYIGPELKFSALLLVGMALAGFGAFIERRSGFADYGGVVLAAGLASIYYTLYAGYHIEQLRVIHSLTVDLVLLVVCAGAIMALAQVRASQWLAMFAVVLGFLPLTMSPVNAASLSANFILAVAAVVMMLRNRWAWVSYVSMLCTYAAFIFWRLPGMEADLLERAGGGRAPFEVEAAFLLAYWCVYTAVVFLSRSPSFGAWERVAYLSINNAALVTLFALRFTGDPATLSLIIMALGGAMAALYLVARYVVRLPEVVGHAYLSQSLILLTGGVVGYFSGLVRSSILLAGSTLLLVRGTQAANVIARAFARLIAGVAFVTVFWHVAEKSDGSTLLGLAGVAVWLFSAWWSRNVPHGQPYVSASASSFEEAPPPPPAAEKVSMLAWLHSFYYCLLAVLTIWPVVVTTMQIQESIFVLAIIALGGVVLAPALRIRELAVVSQGLLTLTQLGVFSTFLDYHRATGTGARVLEASMRINPPEAVFISNCHAALATAVTLAVSAWWTWAHYTRKPVTLGAYGTDIVSDKPEGAGAGDRFGIFTPANLYIWPIPTCMRVIGAIGLVVMLEGVLASHPMLSTQQNMALAAAMALGFFAIAIVAGDWVMTWFSQWFLLHAFYVVMRPPFGEAPLYEIQYTLAPFIAIAGIVHLTEWISRRRQLHGKSIYDGLSVVMWTYIGAGLVTWLVIIPMYVPPHLQLLTRIGSALGVLLYSLAVARESRPYLIVPMVLTALFVWMLNWNAGGMEWSIFGAVAIFLIEAISRADRNYEAYRPWFITLMGAGIAVLMIAVSSDAVRTLDYSIVEPLGTVTADPRRYLTLHWATVAAAIFALGLILRERVYRISGLLLLLLAMGRVFAYDVWQFATIYKIATLFALAIICLGISLAYVWWGKRMREWL